MAKLKIDIERMLIWAYREELPKKELSTSGWDGVAGFLDRGGVEIDRDPWEDHLRSQRYAIGLPHDDALQLDHMVRSLSDVTVQWPGSRGILVGALRCYETPADTVLMRAMKAQSIGLVMQHARMGTRPIWNLEHRLSRVTLKNGKHLTQHVDRHSKVVDCNSGQRDYIRGGQCPLRLDPSVAEIASARFEYFVWHSALVELVRKANASGIFDDHQAMPPAAAQAPWITGERKGRILPALQETGNQERVSRVTEVVGS